MQAIRLQSKEKVFLIRAIVLTIAIFLLLAVCLLGSAGQLSWPMAWAVLGVYLISKIAGLAFADPELIQERAAPDPAADRIDVLIGGLGYLGLYPATFVIAGLDAIRYGPALAISQSIQVMALLIFVFGYGFATWAMLSNPFFSTIVRIQEERNQLVISSGPYALLRHPGYAGALLAHLALPFALGSIWALVPAVAGTIFFVVRTSREDRILQDHLAGYREYQSQVRWRLLPGIW